MQINNRTINRIVVSGCSFTYGRGLENPTDESWPAQLAKLLDVECVNLAWEGMGNEFVQSSIIDYFSANKQHRHDSFVIPCFTAYSRVEFTSWQRQDYNYPEWTTIVKSRINPEWCEQFFKDYFVPDYYYARYMRTIISLQNTLKLWDMPYLMFEALSGNPHRKMMKNEKILSLVSEIDTGNWLGFAKDNIDTWTNPIDRLADGHPNKNAYAQTANILYQHIINTYATE